MHSSCFSQTGEVRDFVIANVHVIPMHVAGTWPDRDVYVRDGRILTVTEHGKNSPPGEFTEIDGTGKYLLPGLAEMHAHIPVPQEGDDSYVRETLFLYLTNGITTIRGMLGDPYHLDLRQQVADGEIPGPRIYTSSPSLNGRTVQSPTQAREKVQQYARDGYDFLKIHPGIQLEVMEELVQTAQEVGISFAGHVPADVGIERAIAYGYASIDHADGYVEGMTPEGTDRAAGGFFGSEFVDIADRHKLGPLCRETAENDIWIVPTQSLFTRWISPERPEAMIQQPEMQYMPPHIRFSWISSKAGILNSEDYSQENYADFIALRHDILRCLHEAGVQFLLGSDAPQVFNVPGFSIQHEMQAMADAGIPVRTILESGTVNPARFFSATDVFGHIDEDLSADLILLEANPLDDIRHMESIAGVMVRGKWLSREEIDVRLSEIAVKYAGE